jgi:hypothetical protein
MGRPKISGVNKAVGEYVNAVRILWRITGNAACAIAMTGIVHADKPRVKTDAGKVVDIFEADSNDLPPSRRLTLESPRLCQGILTRLSKEQRDHRGEKAKRTRINIPSCAILLPITSRF